MTFISRTIAVLLCALLAPVFTLAFAQELPGPCALLTRSEVSAVVGKQVKTSLEMDTTLPAGPSKGQTMTICSWAMGAQDGAALSVMKAPADRAQVASDQSYAGLLKRGWTVEEKSFGNTTCSAVTAPPDSKNRITMTTCRREAKGIALGLTMPNTGEPVAIETVKGLLDKAIARLP